ncbi:MAG: hypothetical protein EPN25_08440 [Nitrospirae bacterium]|nr:MAG: hypothetical protein EPN25_08440 [Nitrospirota bacterium]
MSEPAHAVLDSGPSRGFLLKIGGLMLSVTGDGTFPLGVEGEKTKFIVSEGQADISLRAFLGRLPALSADEIVFDAGPVWQLYRHKGAYLFSFSSLSFGPGPYKLALIDQAFSRGEVYVHPDFQGPGQEVDPLWSPLDQLLISSMLGRGRGAEIHSCGVIDSQGSGHLFVGVSGAGKTTMARLWQGLPGVSILSDDRVILRRLEGNIRMYGTPWHGEGGMAAASDAPLKRIYFLNKADQNALQPLKGAGAATRLFSCCFPPLYDREAVDYTLGFLGQVAQEVPCYELSVFPDERVIGFINSVTESGGSSL